MSPIFYKMHENLRKKRKILNFLEIQIMIGEPRVFRKKISTPIYMDLFYANGLPVYLKYTDPRKYTPIFQHTGICDLKFWIFPFAFAKNGHFFDVY